MFYITYKGNANQNNNEVSHTSEIDTIKMNRSTSVAVNVGK